MAEHATVTLRRNARTRSRKELPPSIKATCAFCKGTGRDPLGVLSHLSTCQVCGGSGEVRVRPPAVSCKFCEGSGVEPYSSSRLICSACKGRAMVGAIENSVPCPTCGGSGIHPLQRTMAFACDKCKGQGVVPNRAKARNSRAKKATSKQE